MTNAGEPSVYPVGRQYIQIKQCWEARGRGSFWVTQFFGYSIGSVLAPLAHRLRVTPNTVTVLSFLTAVLAVVPVAAGMFGSRALEGVYLTLVLLLSYGWDCADGVLARVTDRCSPFGVLWDKIIDLLSLFTIGVTLGFAARNTPPQIESVAGSWELMFPVLLIGSVAPKTLMAVFNWLKDQQLNHMSRTTARTGPMSMADRARRFAGNLTDEPVFRMGIGVSWGLGLYWEYVILFHGVTGLMFALYVADTWRKLTRAGAAADR